MNINYHFIIFILLYYYNYCNLLNNYCNSIQFNFQLRRYIGNLADWKLSDEEEV